MSGWVCKQIWFTFLWVSWVNLYHRLQLVPKWATGIACAKSLAIGCIICSSRNDNFSCSSLQDYMGRCIMTLTRVIMEGEYKDSFPLDGAKSGRLNLNLKWSPQPIYRDMWSAGPSKANPQCPNTSVHTLHTSERRAYMKLFCHILNSFDRHVGYAPTW